MVPPFSRIEHCIFKKEKRGSGGESSTLTVKKKSLCAKDILGIPALQKLEMKVQEFKLSVNKPSMLKTALLLCFCFG